MKFLTRCLLLSLCFVLLLGGSSVPVHAVTDVSLDLKVSSFNAEGGRYFLNNQTIALNEQIAYASSVYEIGVDQYKGFVTQFAVVDAEDQTIATADRKTTLRIQNIVTHHTISFRDVSVNSLHTTPYMTVLFVRYNDGTEGHLDSSALTKTYNQQTTYYDYELTFTPEKDVKKIIIREFYKGFWSASDFEGREGYSGIVNYSFHINAGYTGVTLDIQSEEAGLLGGLIEWVKQIFNKIGEIGTAIAELPSKLWTMIENGLKNLFVPDEQYIEDFHDRWESLLSSRFGAVWESGEYVQLVFAAIVDPPDQDDIHIPEVCINLPESCSFTFGGWTVDIVPDGFEFLATAVKLIVGIACSTLFINGMIKRYDEVMGVEQ